jgi:hypothetical protein
MTAGVTLVDLTASTSAANSSAAGRGHRAHVIFEGVVHIGDGACIGVSQIRTADRRGYRGASPLPARGRCHRADRACARMRPAEMVEAPFRQLRRGEESVIGWGSKEPPSVMPPSARRSTRWHHP